MSSETVIRAWKDANFRAGLNAEERAKLPANPAGVVELSPAELAKAAGGTIWEDIYSFIVGTCGCPPAPTTGQFCTTPCTTSLAGCCTR
jgi:mersacidin/lichenicidin family type 2 lantibiotic